MMFLESSKRKSNKFQRNNGEIRHGRKRNQPWRISPNGTVVEDKNFFRLERSSGSFYRSFRLPVEIQTDKVKATFKNGVLELRMPKTEEAKKKETHIEIR